MWADADRVRQILVNLVMNAVKYGAAVGGEITLSSAVTRDAVSMRVADNGPGIAAEQLATIFDPFVQLASGLTDRRGGVGLGLALSRDLARAMNGELTVASGLTNGSYTDNSGYDTTWARRTVIQKPDASYLTQYFDETGQPLSRLITDANPANTGPQPSM